MTQRMSCMGALCRAKTRCRAFQVSIRHIYIKRRTKGHNPRVSGRLDWLREELQVDTAVGALLGMLPCQLMP